MPNRKKGRKQPGKKPDDGMIRISSGRFQLEMPRPRLPRWLGTPNLSANVSVYPRINLDMPIVTGTASVVAGNIAQTINIDNTLVPNFATRFGATFKEFAIVGARFEIRVYTTAVPQGIVLAFIDEDSNAAPTTTSVNYAHADVPLVGTSVDDRGSLHIVSWVARSYADLTWDGIGTSGVVAYLKLWASPATTGTQATTTAVLSVTGSLAVCFRGYI